MEGEILDATQALAAALSSGDATAAAELYADDGKLLTPAAELIAGRSQILAFWQAGIACGLHTVELERAELTVSTDLAIEVGRYALSVNGNGGRPAVDRGKYVSLHRRLSGGSWRRAVDVFNPDVPGSARPTTEEER